MPRARRRTIQGQAWHITQRCHQREFLLGAREDRQRWLYWLREACARFGLCVLNYIVTRNHVHLLVCDRGGGEIAPAMQLVSGRTAQAYNKREARVGAFWQGRYHRTAIQSDHHLVRCLTYIDLNMVRAGAVRHPRQWRESGYFEIHARRGRRGIIDVEALCRLTGASDEGDLRGRLWRWTEHALRTASLEREPAWTESLAVGSEDYLRTFGAEARLLWRNREITHAGEVWCLRDAGAPYRAPLEIPQSD
jgi:putative transposase